MSGSPKPNSRTTDAVFLPMPGMAASQSRASSGDLAARNSRGVAAAARPQGCECGLDPGRLLVGESSGSDDVGQLGERRHLHGGPVAAGAGRAGRGRPTRRRGAARRARREAGARTDRRPEATRRPPRRSRPRCSRRGSSVSARSWDRGGAARPGDRTRLRASRGRSRRAPGAAWPACGPRLARPAPDRV